MSTFYVFIKNDWNDALTNQMALFSWFRTLQGFQWVLKQTADPLEVGGCDISGVVISFVNLSFLFSINYFFCLLNVSH